MERRGQWQFVRVAAGEENSRVCARRVAGDAGDAFGRVRDFVLRVVSDTGVAVSGVWDDAERVMFSSREVGVVVGVSSAGLVGRVVRDWTGKFSGVAGGMAAGSAPVAGSPLL